MRELYHHGILGQKWGIRRYQNLDGTLTSRGKQRYRENKYGDERRQNRNDRHKSYKKDRMSPNDRLRYKLEKAKLKQEYKTVKYQTKHTGRSTVEKTLAIIGSVVATGATAIKAYDTILKIRSGKAGKKS